MGAQTKLFAAMLVMALVSVTVVAAPAQEPLSRARLAYVRGSSIWTVDADGADRRRSSAATSASQRGRPTAR